MLKFNGQYTDNHLIKTIRSVSCPKADTLLKQLNNTNVRIVIK